MEPRSQQDADDEEYAARAARVAQYLEYKKQGTHLNARLARSAAFSAPRIADKMASRLHIDERALFLRMPDLPRAAYAEAIGKAPAEMTLMPEKRQHDVAADRLARQRRPRTSIAFTKQ